TTPPTELYTLSLHDALPISRDGCANRTPGGKMSSAFRRLPTPSSGKEVPSTAMDLSYAGKVLPVRVLVVDDNALRNAGWSSTTRDRKSTRLNSSHVEISYAV